MSIVLPSAANNNSPKLRRIREVDLLIARVVLGGGYHFANTSVYGRARLRALVRESGCLWMAMQSNSTAMIGLTREARTNLQAALGTPCLLMADDIHLTGAQIRELHRVAVRGGTL